PCTDILIPISQTNTQKPLPLGALIAYLADRQGHDDPLQRHENPCPAGPCNAEPSTYMLAHRVRQIRPERIWTARRAGPERQRGVRPMDGPNNPSRTPTATSHPSGAGCQGHVFGGRARRESDRVVPKNVPDTLARCWRQPSTCQGVGDIFWQLSPAPCRGRGPKTCP